MDQTTPQAKKMGRPRRDATQPARLPAHTLQLLDSICTSLNAIRPAGTSPLIKGRLAAEIISRYAGDYLAECAQQAQNRTQAALQGALLPPPASAAPAAPAAPQSAPQAAPHYFRCGQGAR